MREHREHILEVKDLCKYFKVKAGTLHAVEKVNFFVERGETLGLVGESGCGKSTTGRAILRLHEPTSGEVWFEGENVLEFKGDKKKKCVRKCRLFFRIPTPR